MTSRTRPSKAIPIRIQKQLLRDSGGQCAMCVYPDPSSTTENAHIIPYGEGPRADPAFDGYIHDISNLILLCPNHHTEIDCLPVEKYTADEVRRIKQAHEARISDFRRRTPAHDPVPALKELIAKGQIRSWHVRSEWLPDFFDTAFFTIQSNLREFERNHYLSLPFEDPELSNCYEELTLSFHSLAEVGHACTEIGTPWYSDVENGYRLIKLNKHLGPPDKPYDLNAYNGVRLEVTQREKAMLKALEDFRRLIQASYRAALA